MNINQWSNQTAIGLAPTASYSGATIPVSSRGRRTTNLLQDNPADADAFGGHQDVAESIVDVITTESGGKAIGLEGGWGAGKSTIVNLVGDLLRQSKSQPFKIAVFDMWAHQGDPLRRTFLEHLISQLQDFGWVNTESWNRRLDELSKRRSEDTTRVVPKLTGVGLAFALTLLAVPIGSALVTAGATLFATKDVAVLIPALFLAFGIALALSPAVFYGVVATIRNCRRISESSANEKDNILSDFPALITGQTTTESRTIVTHTPDPTSVEFESVFRELLNDALGQGARKLLLVVDNLDRVEPSDALSIWSTLQTFLGHSDYRRSDWIERLWVLIPYDGNAILRLWEPPVRGAASLSKFSESKLATSFLDKTFQVRFLVPPLLLLNWREFLERNLQKALPEHPKADFRDVYRAFAAKGGPERSAPTPRDLKIYINQIGSLHRIWGDAFPLSHLACYVLLQKEVNNVHDTLLSNEGSDVPQRIIGSQWREIMAAIHFGVPTDEARQLLLRGPIEAALANGDGNGLSDLAAVHPAGFWTVLEDSVPGGESDWKSLDPTDLSRAASALAASGVLDSSASRPEVGAIQSSIRDAVTEVRAWAPFDIENANGLVAIWKLLTEPDSEVPTLLLARASNAPVESMEVPGDGDSATAHRPVPPTMWMESAFTLIEGLVEAGLSDQMADGLITPLSAQQWIDESQEITVRDRGSLLQFLELEDVSALDELTTQRVQQGQLDDETLNAVRSALMTKSGKSMNGTTDAIYSQVTTANHYSGNQVAVMMQILALSRNQGLTTSDEVRNLAENGHYLHHLYIATTDGHAEAVAECMFAFLTAVPDAREPTHTGYSPNGYQELRNLLQDPHHMPGVLELFTARAKETNEPSAFMAMAAIEVPVPQFVVQVLREILIDKEISKTPDLVMQHWPMIHEVLEAESEDSLNLATYLSDLPELSEIANAIVAAGFRSYNIGLYVAMLKTKHAAQLVHWCIDNLHTISQNEWSQALDSHGDLLELIVHLKRRSPSLTLSIAYFDALVEHAERVMKDSTNEPQDESWEDLLNLLSDDHQELFSRRAYGLLESSDGLASEEFFRLFGDLLARRDVLANEQRFVDRVCRPILSANNSEGIAWIAGIVESDPELLTKHQDQAAVSDLIDRVRQRLDDFDEDDPVQFNLQRIGSALGVTNADDVNSKEKP